MGTTLTGTTPQDTYDSLIKVTDNGPLSGTAKYLSDGLGNDSVLALSNARVGVGLNTPTVKLESSGAVKAASGAFGSEGGYLLNFGGNAASRSYRLINDQSSFGDFVIQQSTTQTGSTYADRLYIGAAGNVGIGTSSPAGGGVVSTLRVKQASDGAFGYTGIGIETAAATSELLYFGHSSTKAIIGQTYLGGAGAYQPIAFEVSGSERFRITANGVTFNGDTAAANALDDYEEGTWTMGVSFGGASTGVTYTNNTGTYTKIGRKVTVNGYLLLSSKGSSTGNATITGLPFTIGDGGAYSSAASLWTRSISFLNQFQAIGTTNTTSITFWEVTTGGVLTSLDDVNFANNSDFIISFTYFV